MHKFLIGGLVAAAAIPAIAQVAPVAPVAPMAPAAPMARTSPMADGVMTRAEVQAMVQAHFARMDSNHDGFIAGDELKPRGEWKREGGDGQRKQIMIRREGGPEMAGPDGVHTMIMRDGGPGEHGDPAKMFDRLDTNHDGVISRDEFAKGHEMRIEKRVVMNGPEGAPGAPMRFKMRHMGGGGMMGGRMIKMADLNKDGRISLQEATASALQHFDSADANHDGRLSIDEMRAAHQAMGLHKAG